MRLTVGYLEYMCIVQAGTLSMHFALNESQVLYQAADFEISSAFKWSRKQGKKTFHLVLEEVESGPVGRRL